MFQPIARTALCAAVALAALPTLGAAQVEISSKAAEIKLTGRLHFQWNYSSAAEDLAHLFLIRRARATLEVKINDFVSGKIQPEYAEGDFELKDAYVDLNLDRAFILRFGQFKRPFDLFELTSSTQILVIERAGAIRGVDDCAGVGRLCSYSRFTESLEFSDRDMGIQVSGQVDDRIGYSAAITNGSGQDNLEEAIISAQDDTVELIPEGKSLSGRLTYQPIADLTLAINAAAHDYANPVTRDATDYAYAYGADLEWGDYDAGLHVQAGVVGGDNWRNLDNTGDPGTFLTAQGIVTYKLPVTGHRFIEAVEPLGRISYGDPNTDVESDHGWLLTPGFVVFFSGRNKIALNLDIWSPSEGDTEYGVLAQTYLHF